MYSTAVVHLLHTEQVSSSNLLTSTKHLASQLSWLEHRLDKAGVLCSSHSEATTNLKETEMNWNQSLEKHKQEIEAWTHLCNVYKESLY